LLWDFREPWNKEQIESSVLRFTAHQFKNHMRIPAMKSGI